jgi:hypothetical protein
MYRYFNDIHTYYFNIGTVIEISIKITIFLLHTDIKIVRMNVIKITIFLLQYRY